MTTCPPYGTPSGAAVPRPEQTLAVTRLIAGAITGGAVVFAGVVAFVASAKPAAADVPAADVPFLPWVASGVAILLFAASFLLRATLAASAMRALRDRRGLDASEPGARAMAFQTSTIVGIALNEGPALLACVGGLITRNALDYAPAFSIALVGMILHFPTAAKLDAFLESSRVAAG